MSDKVTAPRIAAMRERGQKIVCITAYDATFGAIADAAGADVVLVGDSVGNTTLGYSSTLPVTLDEMVHHTKATSSGVKRALLVADLPFGSYQASVAQAVESAVTLMKAGAEAVKLEGDYSEAIRAIVHAGIPVMGHLGLTPQSVNKFGGFRVQGKGESGEEIVDQALRIADAGTFAIVLELIPASLADLITQQCDCATIGIGAGPCCDGQIQVLHDVLGFSGQSLKHAKAYVDGSSLLTRALAEYAEEVRSGRFPTTDQSF